MKSCSLFALPALALVMVVASCSDDNTSNGTTSGGVFAGDAGGGGSDGVDCTHPGAGSKLANSDKCECTTTLELAGEWAIRRTCREGDACPVKDQASDWTFTQNGTAFSATSSNQKLTGTVCGDFVVYQGSLTDGSNPSCGQLRFTDSSHFFDDGCYVQSGECNRTFGGGCPSQKGQCTGTGAKKPETAANIQKQVCL